MSTARHSSVWPACRSSPHRRPATALRETGIADTIEGFGRLLAASY
jgi:hypothetical protein